MNEEHWLSIRGQEGKYEVSDKGRVKSLKRKRVQGDVIMVQHTHGKGYKCIWLRSPGMHKKAFVHRLVAEAFIVNLSDKPIVNHKDGNKGNNDLSNLEWVTESENQLHWRRGFSCSVDINVDDVPF